MKNGHSDPDWKMREVRRKTCYMRIVSRITEFYSPSVEKLHEEEELLEEFLSRTIVT
jgi:hypothetical protein